MSSSARLAAHLAQVTLRVRRRRVVILLWWAGNALAALGAVVATWDGSAPLLGLPAEPSTLLAPARVWVLLALGVLVLGAWWRAVSVRDVARRIDDRLGLDDRTAAALAVVRGDVAAGLGPLLVEQAVATLDARGADLAVAFPALPGRTTRRLLAAVTLLVATWTLAIVMSGILGSRSGDGFRIPGWSSGGGALATTATAPDDGDAPTPPALGDGDAEDATEPEPDIAADTPEPTEPEAPPTPDEPPAPDPGPRATAEAIPSAEVFEPEGVMLVLGVAKPGVGLTASGAFEVLVEIDGDEVPTGEAVTLRPDAPRGELRSIRLGRLGAPAKLTAPGEHELRLVLRPTDVEGAPDVRSEPVSFRVRGDESKPDDDGGPPPEPPPPEPSAPDPSRAEPSEPPPPDPTAESPAEPPPAQPLPEPLGTERKVVVPLLDEGETIRKEGPRVVLVPSGGTSPEPRAASPEEAAVLIERRAESALDASRVREADRDLVRRYFESLRRRLLGEGDR